MATVPSSRKLFLPVIHCVHPFGQDGIGHAIANTKIALDNGADGVFLIGHRMHWENLVYVYESVRKANPSAWIGINFLDLTTRGIKKETLLLAISQCVDLSAIWMDALPEEELGIPPWIELFAGVAFKYRNSEAIGEELRSDCESASKYANFATTSGDKTGNPPSVEKLETISSLLSNNTRLAVASGVSRKNVIPMLPYVEAFLVASSISRVDAARGGHEYFIPNEVAALAGIIHSA